MNEEAPLLLGIRVLIFLKPIFIPAFAQFPPENQKLPLNRCDDIGMCDPVKRAVKKLIDSGARFSASVMFTFSGYPGVVEILKKHPQICIGDHLTLNSELNAPCAEESMKNIKKSV